MTALCPVGTAGRRELPHMSAINASRDWGVALMALLLTVLVAVGGPTSYCATAPCLPWQEVSQVAGGTV